jgi:hypothetical protein
MTLYIYRSQNSNHLNRPVKTRLLISVRFVPTIAETNVQRNTDIVTGTFMNYGSQCAQTDAEMGQSTVLPAEPDDPPALREMGGSQRGTIAMRLRLVGPDASTKKEYHHAESLLA